MLVVFGFHRIVHMTTPVAERCFIASAFRLRIVERVAVFADVVEHLTGIGFNAATFGEAAANRENRRALRRKRLDIFAARLN